MMEYSFPHYLLSKQSVDDRSLNRVVLDTLRTNLPAEPIRIIEVGAGIGTMLRRLVRWDIIHKAEYILVDEMAENVDFARAWIPQWAKEADLSVEESKGNSLRLFDESREIHISYERADVFDFIQGRPTPPIY